jgi:hypothetical protein
MEGGGRQPPLLLSSVGARSTSHHPHHLYIYLRLHLSALHSEEAVFLAADAGILALWTSICVWSAAAVRCVEIGFTIGGNRCARERRGKKETNRSLLVRRRRCVTSYRSSLFRVLYTPSTLYVEMTVKPHSFSSRRLSVEKGKKKISPPEL